jgi:guanylate kinase
MNERLLQSIKQYSPSQAALDLEHSYPSLNIAGPTGAGKDTLANFLAQNGNYSTVVSDTTREPRVGEVNGVDYWFISEHEVEKNIEHGAYVEIKQVHEKTAYGTGVLAYKQVVESNRTPILVIDVQGMEELMGYFPGFETILLIPPTFDIWQTRLDGRDIMPIEDKRRRLESALKEIIKPITNPRFHPVINTEVVDTAKLIISGEYKDNEYRERSLKVAQELINRTVAFLEANPQT